jgi:hypothetical protein
MGLSQAEKMHFNKIKQLVRVLCHMAYGTCVKLYCKSTYRKVRKIYEACIGRMRLSV